VAGADAAEPHFATGTKDQDAARIFYEPLAGFDPDGSVVPILAAELPSVDKRRRRARRHLGGVASQERRHLARRANPFSADDVVSNWEYAADPATSAWTLATYRDIERVDKLDAHTGQGGVQSGRRRSGPTRSAGRAACSFRGTSSSPIAAGSRARRRPTCVPSAPAPTGSSTSKPGDVVRGELNPAYHVPHRPFFDTIEMKGGGDAASAARAVLQTGEYDYAWNMQVEDDILRRLEQGGKGRIVVWPTGNPSTSSSTTATPRGRSRASARTPKSVQPDPVGRRRAGRR